MKEFTGIWLPKSILFDKRLTSTSKLIWADIQSLSQGENNYYKSNGTIAKEFNISESSVTRSIKELLALGLIKIVSFDGRNRVLKTSESADNEEAVSSKRRGSLPKVKRQSLKSDKSAPPKRRASIPKEITIKIPIEIKLPYPQEEFGNAWSEWKLDRKERGIKKYSSRGEKGALTKLHKESNGNVATAIEMINQSVANQWRGIFPLKNQYTNGRKKGFAGNQITPDGINDFITNG